jgi:hypothetical protein
MRVKIKDNMRIIENHSHTITDMLIKVEGQLKSYFDMSLILDLKYNKDLTAKDLKNFKSINQAFTKNRLSFVVVNDAINLTDLSAEIVVVPTVLEAHDIIQLDDIQRELGF